jgi:3,4-dihydroxy 2-butanone 4-phosphate synthase/GTP cyclohydrolase II
MARLPDLLVFAQRHGLKIGTIADLIAYRRRHESFVHAVDERIIETPYGGPFKLKVYVNSVDNTEHLALIKGDVSTPDPVLVRMHAVNILEDLFGIGRNSGRRSLVERAMRRIGKEGRGVMVIIRDSCEGVIQARLAETLPATANGSAGEKRLIDYGMVRNLLDLGIKNMVCFRTRRHRNCWPRGMAEPGRAPTTNEKPIHILVVGRFIISSDRSL